MTVKTPISSKTYTRRNDDSSIQPFREENARLRTDVSRLKIEKAQLKGEISHLKEENFQLTKEVRRLREENGCLREELHFTREELREEKAISEQKDLDMARDNALYHMLQEEHLRLQFE